MTDLQWRVVVAADEAGYSYKEAIKADLLKDPRVKEVIDVGVGSDADKTAYPHVAVTGARKIAAGEADRGIFVCGTGVQVSLRGLAGFTLAWVEGVEINVLGGVAGLDLRRPAVKLPGWGRIGLSPA